MSVENLLGDVFSGNFTNALKRLEDWWTSLQPSIKAFVNKVETDEGKILVTLAEQAAQSVITNGLTTASFVSAAKDVGSQLLAQNITMAQTDVFAALNIAVSDLQAK